MLMFFLGALLQWALTKNQLLQNPGKKRTLRKKRTEESEGKLRKDRVYWIPRRRDMEGSKASASVIASAQELPRAQ